MIKYYLPKRCKILFIGINPHHGSFRRGVPFSNNKMFWYLLNKSGIINERLEDLKNDSKLKQIYSKKFSKVYHLGLINLIDRPSKDVSELKKGEETMGQKRILNAIKNRKPSVVCFIGKITFQKFSGEKEVNFGWQKKIFHSNVFVMHFPIRGKANIRLKDLSMISNLL